MDSTHGTNNSDVYLITVLVIDEFQCGCPVAFCISNKQYEHALRKKKLELKLQVGIIQCNTLMTDDAPAFQSAWNAIMHPPRNMLLCSWHIDRAWRNRLKKVKGVDEKRALVCKTLRSFMEFNESNKFAEIQNNALTAMF